MIPTTQIINANNFMPTRIKFLQREAYQKEVLPSEYYNYYANLWYTNYFYGRIDEKNNPIYVDEEENLKLFDLQQKEIAALDFVVDAFTDMKFYFDDLVRCGKISPQSSYYNINPQKAYVSPKEIYKKYLTNFVNQIYLKLGNDPTKKNIKTFNDYLKVFLEHITKETNTSPVTFSTFIISNLNDPMSSGLMIEIEAPKNATYDDDQKKVQFFTNDPNFDAFLDSAKRFGFMVDKNVPWRLIADLESPAMKKYMGNYLVLNSTKFMTNRQDVFKTKYKKAHLLDIELLRIILKDSYNFFASEIPVGIADKFNKTCSKTIIETTERKQLSDMQLEEQCDQYFFNKLYVFLKNAETKKNLTQKEFEQLSLSANQISKYISQDSSLEFMFSNFKALENLLFEKKDFTEEIVDVKLQQVAGAVRNTIIFR